jgi:predicted short-subunit dehydrogenase-like oxidoreductase (DUF2520 family)
MNIEIHGSGAAAGALAIAATRSGHVIVAIHGRNRDAVGTVERLIGPQAATTADHVDLRIIAVSDRAINEVAASLAEADPVPTVHVSGSRPIDDLEPLSERGIATGSVHPLQTLPDAERGADLLPGSFVAVTAAEPLSELLNEFVRSLGCRPFPLDDDVKMLYHAAASSFANFTVACLGLGADLLARSEVPLAVARPLVEAAVSNAFDMGPRAVLTGPIARGDVATVLGHISAIEETGPDNLAMYRAMARATAIFAGASDEVLEAIG